MTNRRRNFVPGGCQFFTVNLAARKSRLLADHVDFLRAAFATPARDIRLRSRRSWCCRIISILSGRCRITTPTTDTWRSGKSDGSRKGSTHPTRSNYFLCRDPGAGFAPSCLGECAIAARHEPEHRTMWYRKNVGGWERAARLIGGGLMLICVVALHASPLGLLLSGAGVVTLVTGVFGYCPACAIAGREPLKG
jgi:hypothetical protein